MPGLRWQWWPELIHYMSLESKLLGWFRKLKTVAMFEYRLLSVLGILLVISFVSLLPLFMSAFFEWFGHNRILTSNKKAKISVSKSLPQKKSCWPNYYFVKGHTKISIHTKIIKTLQRKHFPVTKQPLIDLLLLSEKLFFSFRVSLFFSRVSYPNASVKKYVCLLSFQKGSRLESEALKREIERWKKEERKK